MYSCRRCHYEAKRKEHMQKHLMNKQECMCKYEAIPREELLKELNIKHHDKESRTLQCKKCHAMYTHPSTLSRHMKSCTGTKHLEAQASTSSNNNTSHNTISGNHNSFTVNNNITIVKNSYGNERIDHLQKELEFLYDRLYTRNIIPLIESIYCDPEHPENHTVRYKNVKQKLMEKYIDQEWILASQDDIFQDLINKGFNVLKLHVRKNETHVRQRLIDDDDDDEEFDEIVRWVNAGSDDDKQVIKLRNHLVILFRNNKAMLLSRD